MAQLKKKISDFASKGPFVFAKWNNIIDVKMYWKIIVFKYFITKLFGRFYLSVLLGIVKLRGRLYYLAILFLSSEDQASKACDFFSQQIPVQLLNKREFQPLKANGHLFLDDCICPVEDQGGKASDFFSQQIPNFQFYFISLSYSIPVQFNLLFYNQTQI